MTTPLAITAAAVTPIASSLSSSSSSLPSSIDTNRTGNVSMKSSLSFAVTFSFSPCVTVPHLNLQRRIRTRMISCEVALKSDSTASSSSSVDKDDSSSASSALPEEAKKIGARVRVKVPLKVYHVPRVPEVDLTGMEGELKQYVGLWKGKRISANFPFKVEFRTEIEGRGPVKFFAHLKEDEFEYL